MWMVVCLLSMIPGMDLWLVQCVPCLSHSDCWTQTPAPCDLGKIGWVGKWITKANKTKKSCFSIVLMTSIHCRRREASCAPFMYVLPSCRVLNERSSKVYFYIASENTGCGVLHNIPSIICAALRFFNKSAYPSQVLAFFRCLNSLFKLYYFSSYSHWMWLHLYTMTCRVGVKHITLPLTHYFYRGTNSTTGLDLFLYHFGTKNTKNPHINFYKSWGAFFKIYFW